MADLVWLSAVEQARMVRSGEISARELVDAHLRRIDTVNPALNAIVTIEAERAMAAAAAADAALAGGEGVGVLHGLPVAHKDLVDTAGIRTTSGSPILVDNIPETDALIVERIAAAGAITVGKTNTPEFGAGSQTFNQVFGATANPYDLSKTCGGSSGGAAVALAAGMVPIADGSDMGGSLRNPAAFCNVVGFRVSPGRVPSWPKDAAWTHLSVEGPMARSVEDLALLLSVMAGPDPRSPIALETPGGSFSPPIPADVAGMRVAWAPDLGGLPIDPAVRSALSGTPEVFTDLGCDVEEAAPDLRNARAIFQMRRAWSYELGLGRVYEQRPDDLKATIRWNIEQARRFSMVDHARMAKAHAALYQRVVAFFDTYDLLVCPTVQVPPFDLDQEYVTAVDGVEMETYIDWMRSCTDVTVMGCPAISVPGGFTADGLPIGLQLVGPPRADFEVLRFARAFEQATRFGERRPESAT